MWIALIAAAAIALAGIVLARRAAGRRAKRGVDWREPEGAVEHFVLLAMLAEAATAREGAEIWIDVDWTWGRDRDDAVKLHFVGADALSDYAESAPGRYLRERMDVERCVTRGFDFPVSSGGAPRCFRSGSEAMDFIRPFAPHAYVDGETMNHFRVRFRRHAASQLPKGYGSPEGLESQILKRFSSH